MYCLCSKLKKNCQNIGSVLTRTRPPFTAPHGSQITYRILFFHKPDKVAVSTWSIPSSLWSGQKCWWYFGRRVVSSIDPPLSSCFSQNSVTHYHRHHFCHSPFLYHRHFCVRVFFGILTKLRQVSGGCWGDIESDCSALQREGSTCLKDHSWRQIISPPPSWCSSRPSGSGDPHCRGFTTTYRHSTLGRIPLNEWASPCRDLYLTTHNTHKRQISMPPPAGFEYEIPASEWPQTYALDRAATGTGRQIIHLF